MVVKHYLSTSYAHKLGDHLVGKRGGTKGNYVPGILVETYYTLNNGYRNYAFVLLCDEDGKKRSFQYVTPFWEDAPNVRKAYLEAWPAIRREIKLARAQKEANTKELILRIEKERKEKGYGMGN